jgi:hypothetical protein
MVATDAPQTGYSAAQKAAIGNRGGQIIEQLGGRDPGAGGFPRPAVTNGARPPVTQVSEQRTVEDVQRELAREGYNARTDAAINQRYRTYVPGRPQPSQPPSALDDTRSTQVPGLPDGVLLRFRQRAHDAYPYDDPASRKKRGDAEMKLIDGYRQ